MTIQAKPFINIGPGQIISREMNALNWNQEDLSQILGLTPKSISLILNNKQRITIETAKLLSKAFNTSPELWLNLDQNYRLRLSNDTKAMKETEVKAEIRKYMPILEMKKKGWLHFDTQSTTSQKRAFCEFWGVQKLNFDMYIKRSPFHARRNNDDEIYTTYYSQTWFRKAEIEASKIAVSEYKKEKLQGILENIEHYIFSKEGISLFIKKLEDCGVKFFVLSHLEKTYLDGACFMNSENPTIVYTARHKNIDSFWWTIVHELAHVLLHLKKEKKYLDVLDFAEDDHDSDEKQADEFTSKVFKKEEIICEYKHLKKRLSENSLQVISKKLKLPEALVLGILQFSGIQSYRTKLNHHKYSAVDYIPDIYLKG